MLSYSLLGSLIYRVVTYALVVAIASTSTVPLMRHLPEATAAYLGMMQQLGLVAPDPNAPNGFRTTTPMGMEGMKGMVPSIGPDGEPVGFLLNADALQMDETQFEPDALADPISVSRVQSAYAAADAVTGTLTITFTVTNNRPPAVVPDLPENATITETIDAVSVIDFSTDPNVIHNVLLADNLLPANAAFVSSSPMPDRSEDSMAWNLGNVPPLSSVTAALTVEIVPGSTPDFLELDTGATAWGTLEGRMVSAAAAPASLAPDGFADWLIWTVDADYYDEYMVAKAAELSNDWQQMFGYARSLGYESYKGSLRGTRGTLWSEAGNSMDQASLLIAMLRGSGIPARYRHGTLSTARAQELILAMFPTPQGTIGHIPPGTEVADPANDPQLLAETTDHWWVEAYLPGVGWTDLDPCFAGALPGETFHDGLAADGSDQIAEAPDGQRHKVTMTVKIEKYHPLNVGQSGLTYAYPLAHTFNTVELVGRPVTLGHLVNSDTDVGVFWVVQHTYVPYFAVAGSEMVIEGDAFQDVISNFPFGNFVTTGEWLLFDVQDVDGSIEHYEREVVDRVGFDNRITGGTVNMDIIGQPDPLVTSVDVFSVIFSAWATSQNALDAANYALLDLAPQMTAALNTHMDSPESSRATIDLAHRVSTAQNKRLGFEYSMLSDAGESILSNRMLTIAYPDTPRISVMSARVISQSLVYSTDLLANNIRILGMPGQAKVSEFALRTYRGIYESTIEGFIIGRLSDSPSISTTSIFEAASKQGIDTLVIGQSNLEKLQNLPISKASQSRIVQAVHNSKLVILPARPVTIEDELLMGWWEMSSDGTIEGMLENGTHGCMMSIIGQGKYLVPALALSGLVLVLSAIGGLILGLAVSMEDISSHCPKSTYDKIMTVAVAFATALAGVLAAIGTVLALGALSEQDVTTLAVLAALFAVKESVLTGAVALFVAAAVGVVYLRCANYDNDDDDGDDHSCTEPGCSSSCTGASCASSCTADDCSSTCTGAPCGSTCNGSNCTSTCIGNGCTSCANGTCFKCTGARCSVNCTGDSCTCTDAAECQCTEGACPPPPEDPPPPTCEAHWVVQPGDTFGGIEYRFGVTESDLRTANQSCTADLPLDPDHPDIFTHVENICSDDRVSYPCAFVGSSAFDSYFPDDCLCAQLCYGQSICIPSTPETTSSLGKPGEDFAYGNSIDAASSLFSVLDYSIPIPASMSASTPSLTLASSSRSTTCFSAFSTGGGDKVLRVPVAYTQDLAWVDTETNWAITNTAEIEPYPLQPIQLASKRVSSLPDQVGVVYTSVSGLPAENFVADVQTNHAMLKGYLLSNWQSAAQTSVQYQAFSAVSGTVRTIDGQVLGSGQIYALGMISDDTVLSGDDVVYNTDGWGSLASYASASPGVTIASKWSYYQMEGTSPSFEPITAHVYALWIDDTLHEDGVYIIDLNSPIILWGDGLGLMTTFADQWQADVHGASIRLAPGTGSASLGSHVLDAGQGIAAAGFSGAITITEQTADLDRVQLAGTVDQLVELDVSPAANAVEPFQSAHFRIDVLSNITDTYYLQVSGPSGWDIELDSSSAVTATPGVNTAVEGDYTFSIVAQSYTRPELVASTEHTVSILPHQGMEMDVASDPFTTVPWGPANPDALPGDTNNGQLQLTGAAYTVGITNTSTTSHTFAIDVSGLPDGWLILSGAEGQTQTFVTLPAGGVGQVGLYISPTLTALPPAGTAYPFSVDVTAMDNPALHEVDTDTFTVPAVAFNHVTLAPDALFISPGGAATFELKVTNVGNAPGTFPLSATLPITTWLISDLQSPITLDPGETHMQPFTITVPADALLGQREMIRLDSPAPDNVYVQTAYTGVEIVSAEALAVYRATEEAGELYPDDVSLITSLDFLALSIDEFTQSCQDGACDLTLRDRVASGADAVAQAAASISPLVTADETLPPIADALREHTAEADLLDDLAALSDAIDTLMDELRAVAQHNLEAAFSPGLANVLQGAPAQFELQVTNRGSQPTTAELVLAPPPGSDASWSTRSLTLQAGETLTVPTVITSTTLGFFLVQVDVSAAETGLVQYSTKAGLGVVDALLRINRVDPYPGFVQVSAGVPVAVNVEVANVVNVPITGDAQVQVIAADDTVVASATTPLTVPSSIGPQVLQAAEIDTGSLVTGTYTVTVRLVDGHGALIPKASGSGTLAVGQAVEAHAWVEPVVVPPGEATVDTTIETELDPALLEPTQPDGAALDRAPKPDSRMYHKGVYAPSPAVVAPLAAGPIDEYNSTIVIDSLQLLGDGVDSTTVFVSLRDASNDPIDNREVELWIQHEGEHTFINSNTTNAAGEVTFDLAWNDVGWVNVIIYDPFYDPGYTNGLWADEPVEFIAGPVDPIASTVEVAPSSRLVAINEYGEDNWAVITATLITESGHPYADQDADLLVDGMPDNNETTYEDGTVVFELFRTTPGTVTLDIRTYDLQTGAPATVLPVGTVEFVTGSLDPGYSTVAVTPTEVLADGVSAAMVTITLRDYYENPVANRPIELWGLDFMDEGGDERHFVASGLTDENGVAVMELAWDGQAAVMPFIIDPAYPDDEIGASDTVYFVLGPIDPNHPGNDIVVTSSDPILAAMCEPIMVEAVLYTESGHLPDEEREFELLVGDTVVYGGYFEQDGSIYTEFYPMQAGTFVLSIRDVTYDVTVPVDTLEILPGLVSPYSTIVAVPGTIANDGVESAVITATLQDYGHNPIANRWVDWVFDGSSSGEVFVAGGFTDEDGVLTHTLTWTITEELTIGVFDSIPGTGYEGYWFSDTQVFVVDNLAPVNAAQSTIEMAPTTVVADGAEEAVISATLRTEAGQLVTGREIKLLVDGVVRQTAITNEDGYCLFYLSSSEVGPVSVALRDVEFDVVVPVGTVDFVVGPPDAERSYITIDSDVAIADDQDNILLQVTLLDSVGHPIPDKYISFVDDFLGLNIWLRTNADGQTTSVSLRTSRAGVYTIYAREVDSGVTFGPAIVTFVAGALSEEESRIVLEPDPPVVVANGMNTLTVTAVLSDAYGNRLVDRPISLSVSGTGNVISPTAQYNTDANGAITFTVTSSDAGTKTLSLYDVEGDVNVSLGDVNFVPGVVDPAQSGITVDRHTAPADGTTPVQVTVTLRDAYDNLLPGVEVTLTFTGTTAVAEPISGISDVGGRWSSTLTADAYDTVTLRASAGGLWLDDTVTVDFIGPDLVVAKDGPDTALTQSPLTYTLMVENTGLAVAQDVTLTDTLPTGVLFFEQVGPYAPIQVEDAVVWHLGALDAGESVEVVVIGWVTGDVFLGTQLTNQAVATTSTPEEDASDNAASSVATVIASYVYEAAIAPPARTAPLGAVALYDVVVQNAGHRPDTYDLSVNVPGLDPAWYALDRTELTLDPGEIAHVKLTVQVADHSAAGTYSVFAMIHSTALDNTQTGSGELTLTQSPSIYDLMPADGAKIGTQSALFSWQTGVTATTSLYMRPVGSGSFTSYTGEAGIMHRVTVDGLTPYTDYEWYVHTASAYGEQTSEIRVLHVLNGSAFSQRVYPVEVERDYNQIVTLEVQNLDTVSHTAVISIENAYPELIVGFVGAGSYETPITLPPGQMHPITLAIHTQDVVQADFSLVARLTADDHIGGTIEDAVPVDVHVRFPNVDFTITHISTDPQTLISTYRVTNHGDTLTDLAITAKVTGTGSLYLYPSMSHGYLKSGSSFEFEAVPVVDTSFQALTGTLTASAAGTSEAVEVQLSLPDGYGMYLGEAEGVSMEASAKDWYCTNRPVINNKIVLPPGFRRDDAVSANFYLNITDQWGVGSSSVKPHNVYIYVNDGQIGALENLVPQGMYTFPITPTLLNESLYSPSVNYIKLHTTHMNGGHYVVAHDMIVQICLDGYREWVAAPSQEAADQIVQNRSYLIQAPETIDVQIESPVAGRPLYAGVETPVQARIVDDADRALFYQATVQVKDGSGNTWELLLYDDGVHGDDAYKDGVYANTWIPARAGTMTLTFRASNCQAWASNQITVDVESLDHDVTVDHRVPLSGTAIITPTFSPPPQDMSTAGEETAVRWTHVLSGSHPSQQDTFTVQLSDLQPGEVRQVSNGTVITSTGAEGMGVVHLPPLYVAVAHLTAISPAVQTANPGGLAVYHVVVNNPGPEADTFTLSAAGLPQSWVEMVDEVTLAAGQQAVLSLTIHIPTDTDPDTYDLGVVVHAAAGGQDHAGARLNVADALEVDISPEWEFVESGGTATYAVTITNLEDSARMYHVAVDGLEASVAVVIEPVTVEAGETLTVPLAVIAYESEGAHAFSVGVTSVDTPANASVDAALYVLGDYRVQAGLTPATATGGPGTPLTYTLTITNSGNLADTYTIGVDVPPEWSYRLSANGAPVDTLGLTPHVFNAANLDLVVWPALDAQPGTYDVRALVQSQGNPSVVAETEGIAIVTERGVVVRLLPDQMTLSPAGTAIWEVEVTNTGSVADTYTLSAGGIIAETPQFSENPVSLAPQQTRVIQLTAPQMDFALKQEYVAIVKATSLADSRIWNTDEATITFEGYEAVDVGILPVAQTITNTLETSFMVVITNTGNVDTVYTLSASGDPALSLELEVAEVYIPPHMAAGILVTAQAPTTGTYTITVQADSTTSEVSGSGSATLIAVTANRPPVALDDAVTTDEDTAVTVNVLSNDSDADGNPLAVASVAPGAHGSVAIGSDDTVIYMPDADYHGVDSFTYVVTDGELMDTATVAVTVEPAADAPAAVDDVATTDEDTAAVIDVLVNDSDVDGDSLSIKSVTPPAHGSVLITFEDTLIYTPNPDYNGADNFSYVISDGVLTDTATVEMLVVPMPDAPQAADDSATTDQDTAVTIDVLDNDSDVDGDSLSVALVTQPFHGAVANNDTDVTYTPGTGYSGTDSFTYVVTDGVLTDTATVIVTVGEAPSGCALYPIALHADMLAGVQAGTEIRNIYSGAGRGNFGWLTWTGDPSAPTLAHSLTPPGDSSTYVNPYDADDHAVSVGDWVYGKPGVSNSKTVRDALNDLKGHTITVPVWDKAAGHGSNLAYRIVGFASVRITSYRLAGWDRISAIFEGYTVCSSSCEDAVPVDLIYVLDVSGSMDRAYRGWNTKLDAAKQAILTTNEWVARQNNGSRVALVTFHSGRGSGNPLIYPADVQLTSEFTEDVDAFNTAMLALDASGGTPTAAALEEVADWLPGAVNADHRVVVILISDGVPTMDLEGHFFAGWDVQQVNLYNAYGEFLTPDQARLRGKYYHAYRERAGEPLADTMVALQHLKTEMPEAVVHTVAVETCCKGMFGADILRYVATQGGGEFFVARNMLGLVDALQLAYVGAACGGGVPLNTAPMVNTGPDQVVSVGDKVTFTGTFTDPDPLDTHVIAWDWGDGNTANGPLTPTYTYAAHGTYTVTLTVTDSRGGVGSDTLVVTVEELAPVLSGLHASQSIKIQDRTTVAGSVSSGGYVEIGAKARVAGDVAAKDDAFLRWQARVEGDVTLGGRLRRQPGVVITGALEEKAAVSVPDVPVHEVMHGARNVTVKHGERDAWAPGEYRNGIVQARGSVVLTAGTYNFRGLWIEPDAEITLDVSAGEILIDVEQALVFGDRSRVVTQNSEKVTFYTNASDTVRVGKNVVFDGSLVAPRAKVHVFSRTAFEGNIAAKRIVLEPEVVLHCSR
jgi:uncharacterized repeat protein (TIGR01451 family)